MVPRATGGINESVAHRRGADDARQSGMGVRWIAIPEVLTDSSGAISLTPANVDAPFEGATSSSCDRKRIYHVTLIGLASGPFPSAGGTEEDGLRQNFFRQS